MEVRRLNSSLGHSEFSLRPRLAHLVFVENGHLEVDGAVRGGEALWLPPAGEARLRAEAGTRALIVALSPLELSRIFSQDGLRDRLSALMEISLRVSLTPPDQQRLMAQLDIITAETQAPRPESATLCEAAMTLAVVQIWRSLRPEVASTFDLSPAERFVQLAAHHWQDHWSVQRYAATLGVSRAHLGQAVRRLTGQSPQDYLHERIVENARHLLAHSPLQIAAIAYRLGYQDPAYFNRFFQRRAGQTPGRYRRDHARAARQSFASWP